MSQVNPDFGDIPPWLRYFFIHVVGRCLRILDKWIEELKQADV